MCVCVCVCVCVCGGGCTECVVFPSTCRRRQAQPLRSLPRHCTASEENSSVPAVNAVSYVNCTRAVFASPGEGIAMYRSEPRGKWVPLLWLSSVSFAFRGEEQLIPVIELSAA